MNVLLPVETVARELDAKLLVSLYAIRRGVTVYLGGKSLMSLDIARFPRGVYVTNNFDPGRRRIITIARRLGHRVVGWDEEGLVWINAKIYRDRRIDEASLARLDRVYAWGRDQAEAIGPLAEKHGVDIKVIGNPRADLLHTRLRAIHEAAALSLRRHWGKVILINSNFGWLNHALARNKGSVSTERELATLARRARFPFDYMAHRLAIYRKFRDLVPRLAARFGDHTIVVRPHPSEDPSDWQRLCAGIGNAKVHYDGDIVAWLLAADVVIHNGCTTAIETALLGRQPIMYRPIDGGDNELMQPLRVSLEAVDEAALFAAVEEVLADPGLRPAQARGLNGLVACANSDALAAQSIADDLAAFAAAPTAHGRMRTIAGYAGARLRRLEKTALRHLATSPANPRYIDKKFPPMDAGELRRRLARLAEPLGLASARVDMVSDRVFRLTQE